MAWLQNFHTQLSTNAERVLQQIKENLQEFLQKSIRLLNEKAKEHKILQDQILDLQITFQEVRKELVRSAQIVDKTELQALLIRKDELYRQIEDYKELDEEVVRNIRILEKGVNKIKPQLDRLKAKQNDFIALYPKEGLENTLQQLRIDSDLIEEVFEEIRKIEQKSSASTNHTSINLEKKLENEEVYKDMVIEEFFATSTENFFEKENNFRINVDEFLLKTDKQKLIENFFSDSEEQQIQEIEKSLKGNYENTKTKLQQMFDDFFGEKKLDDKQKQIDDFFKNT